MKLIKITAIAILSITLASCGKSYTLKQVNTGITYYAEQSEIGSSHKVGDTIKQINTPTLICGKFKLTTCTGVIIEVK
jgi:hypothetical protein